MNLIAPHWSVGEPRLELKGEGVVEDRLERLGVGGLKLLPWAMGCSRVGATNQGLRMGARASESSRSLASRQAWTRAASASKGARNVGRGGVRNSGRAR